MRLRTKLVLAAAGVTFAIVVVLSAVFLAELLRQRVAQTAANDDVMARQVRMMTAQAVQEGLTDVPPADGSAEAFAGAVTRAVREHTPLTDTMDALVRYSPLVEDVSVADAAWQGAGEHGPGARRQGGAGADELRPDAERGRAA